MRYPAPLIIAKDLYAMEPIAARRETAPEPHSGYPFFTPRREIHVLHGELGRIVDISMGGIRFTYATTDQLPVKPAAECMLFTNVDDYLKEIPLQVLADKTIFHLLESEYLLKERRARFGNLTQRQIRRLERFILKNAHIPRSGRGTRQMPPNPLRRPGPERLGNGLNFTEEMP